MAKTGRKRAKLEIGPGPTKERMGKAQGYVDRGDTGAVTMRDSPIERALAQENILRDEHTAATKWYHHWYHAGLASHLGSADLMRVFGGESGFSGMAKTESQAFHRQRYREAVQIVGLLGSRVLEWVICEERSFESAGRELLGWNNRPQATAAAIASTRVWLRMLCKEWGIGP